jgi:hypothetical protein
MKSTRNTTKATWLTVIRSNLDDEIVGAYPTLNQARARMRLVLGNPDSVRSTEIMRTLDLSGVIAVAIYRVKGDQTTHWEQQEFGDEKEAA